MCEKIEKKYYKECNVVMLESNMSFLYLHGNKLYNSRTTMHIPDGKQIPQHIYILSIDEADIKAGDLCFNSYDKRIWEYQPAPCPMPYWGNKTTLSKIIATTDEKLGLPTLPIEFIELYCKNNSIDKVLMKY